jgi:hypothetical protein
MSLRDGGSTPRLRHQTRRRRTGDFAVGGTVEARFTSPLGPTRLPRCVRGHIGQIEACHGWHVLPDAAARGEERAEPPYSVGFLAREPWDDVSATKDRVHVDLWQSYREPL